LMFSNGTKRRQKSISAGDLDSLMDQISLAKSRFKQADDVEIFSCYEAGRDGFWPHRYLRDSGINNVVVDSSSIEVNRRYR
jgi:transposase